MAITNGETKHHRGVIGNSDDFWLYSSKTGFNITHPAKFDSPPLTPDVTIKTTNTPITIDPAKSALVIIDMQNFFLSPAFGRTKGAGHAALEQLVNNAIPAARKAGIRIIWLNWGLTQHEVDNLPPAVARSFGFKTLEHEEGLLNGHIFEAKGSGNAVNKHGQQGQKGGYVGLGGECGMSRTLRRARGLMLESC